MKVAIYGPVSLWDYHHAATIDIAWRERELGSDVGLIFCQEALGSCPANPMHVKRKCIDCINQNKYSISKHFPKDIRTSWISPALINEDIRKAISAIKSQAELEIFCIGNWQVGKDTLSHLISEYRSEFIPNEIIRTTGIKILEKAIMFHFAAKEILSEGFEKIYIWGGRRASESSVISAAKELGLDIIYYEVASSKEKFNISRNELHSFAGIKKEVEYWNEQSLSSNEYISTRLTPEDYFRRLREGRGADPHYRNFLSGYKDELPAVLKKSKKPVLTFFTSSAWEFAMFVDNKHTSDDFQDSYRLLNRIVHDQEITKRFFVVIRWHPNLKTAGHLEVNQMKQIIEHSPWVFHIKPNDELNSYEVVNSSEIIVSTGSTIGLEAVVMGKPSILLGNSQYSGLGSVYEPGNYDEFLTLIKNNCPPLSPEGAFRWAEWMGNFGENFNYVTVMNDGYFINGEEIRYRNCLSRVIANWLITKHKVKFGLLKLLGKNSSS